MNKIIKEIAGKILKTIKNTLPSNNKKSTCPKNIILELTQVQLN